MYNTINIQFICAKCPQGMNKDNCPVRKYINEESTLFHESVNENVVMLNKPYIAERVKYEWALANIQNICAKCQTKENQR